jgi:hypothetical protein
MSKKKGATIKQMEKKGQTRRRGLTIEKKTLSKPVQLAANSERSS